MTEKNRIPMGELCAGAYLLRRLKTVFVPYGIQDINVIVALFASAEPGGDYATVIKGQNR